MFLTGIRVQNCRRFRDSGTISLCRLQALIGENNVGKSTLLSAIECLTSAGAGGVTERDFRDPEKEMAIRGVFSELTDSEVAVWKSYLVNGELILEKRLWLDADERTAKRSVKVEFHGYRAEPADWHLSMAKIEERSDGKATKWADLVAEHGLPEYFYGDPAAKKCTKANYAAGIARYLAEHDVPFDPPSASATQALGLQSRVIASLPAVFLLPAITDYSSEIDRRSTTTAFRRLMAELSDRVLHTDARYSEVIATAEKLRALLNGSADGSVERVPTLGLVEGWISEMLRHLMPSVGGVTLAVATDSAKEVFSRGVELFVDDGVHTDVLAKGHGLQRCVVFTLLRALIASQRDALRPSEPTVAKSNAVIRASDNRSILLLIEEPELYIHPQLCKLFYDTMTEFAAADQVVYTTHSPLFVDAGEYKSIVVVRSDSGAQESFVHNCEEEAFAGLPDRSIFKGFTRLNAAVNELFFARHVLLVEGPEDAICVAATCIAERMIRRRLEELDVTVIVAGGKSSIPFFQRVLNAFRIPYAVLHDVDVGGSAITDEEKTEQVRNANIANLAGSRAVVTFPHKLETSLGIEGHLRDQYTAHAFFARANNITEDVRRIVKDAVARAREPWAAIPAEHRLTVGLFTEAAP